MRRHLIFGYLMVGVLLMLLPAPSAWAHPRTRVSVFFFHDFFWPSFYYYPPPYYRPTYIPEEAAIDTDVHPERAEVWLDGHYVGIADQFDGFPRYLKVSPGSHRLEFRLEGYRSLRIDLNARRGRLYELDRTLRLAGDEGSEEGDSRGRDRHRNREGQRDRHDDRYSEDSDDY